MKRKYTKAQLLQVTNRGTKIYAACSYPEENPPNTIEDIALFLGYLGLFENIVDSK